MEQFKDLGKDRTTLGVLCFLVTTTILTFVDFLCVGAYFGLIVCLLYLTFVKDFLEIFAFTTVRCVTRLQWLYRILKISELLYSTNQTDGLDSNNTGNDSVGVLSNTCHVKNSLDAVASSSCGSKSTLDHSLFSSGQSGSSLQTGDTSSPALFQSPLSSISGSEEPTPRKSRSLSTHITSSTDNFNIIDESNFEDVDLSDEKIERNIATNLEESNFKQSSLRWNISNMKIFDSFRRNKTSPVVKTQLGNIAAKVTKALPQRADKEKLISDKESSPEQVGCCTAFPHLLKVKYHDSIEPYARF